MKTAISLPDETFNRASHRAKALGMSRSEFFARAADRYLDELDATSVTKQINDSLALAGEVDESSGAAVDAGRDVLLTSADEW